MSAPIQQILLANNGPGAHALAFLARTSGLDSTHTTLYTNLINGLDIYGLFSKLDALYTFATQDSATALLNLISSNYNCVSHGPPTFTADRGFTGAAGSTTLYLDTQFNPITATSPQYVQDAGHISIWNFAHPTSGITTNNMGQIISGAETGIYAGYTDGNSYFRVQTNNATAGVADTNGTGHYIANRSSASAIQGYRNGSQVQSISSTSTLSQSRTLYVLAHHDFSLNATDGSGSTTSSASIGASLNSTDAGNLYNLLHTFMVGVGAA